MFAYQSLKKEFNTAHFFIASKNVMKDYFVGAQVGFSRVQHAFLHPMAVISADCSCSHVNVKQLQAWTRTTTDRTAGAVKMLHLPIDISLRQCMAIRLCVCVCKPSFVQALWSDKKQMWGSLNMSVSRSPDNLWLCNEIKKHEKLWSITHWRASMMCLCLIRHCTVCVTNCIGGGSIQILCCSWSGSQATPGWSIYTSYGSRDCQESSSPLILRLSTNISFITTKLVL